MPRKHTGVVNSLFNHIRLYTLKDSKPIIKQGNVIDVSPEVASSLHKLNYVEEAHCGPDDESRFELMYWVKEDYSFGEVKEIALRLNENLLINVVDKIIEDKGTFSDKVKTIASLAFRHNAFAYQGKATTTARLLTFKRAPLYLGTVSELFTNYFGVDGHRTQKTWSIRGTKGNVLVAQKFFHLVKAHCTNQRQFITVLSSVDSEWKKFEKEKGRTTNVA
jgi:hypothetical protein